MSSRRAQLWSWAYDQPTRQWGIVGTMTGHKTHTESHLYQSKNVKAWDPRSMRILTETRTVYELGKKWDPEEMFGTSSPAQCYFFGHQAGTGAPS